jgi:hypothetical protein
MLIAPRVWMALMPLLLMMMVVVGYYDDAHTGGHHQIFLVHGLTMIPAVSHHHSFASISRFHSTMRSMSASSSSISMHMGHSHSHHHHHHHHPHDNKNLHIPSNVDTSTLSTITTGQPMNIKTLALLILITIVSLGSPIVLSHRRRSFMTSIFNHPFILSSSDWTTFFITISALIAVEPIRMYVKNRLDRMELIQHNIAKHSTPIDMSYFFRNKNPADRVTLLGYVDIFILGTFVFLFLFFNCFAVLSHHVWIVFALFPLFFSAAINLVLSTSKFFVGVACNSAVLIADAGHSLSDLFSDFVTLWVRACILLTLRFSFLHEIVFWFSLQSFFFSFLGGLVFLYFFSF